MIQLRQRDDLVVAIAAVLQRLVDRFEIIVCRYLNQGIDWFSAIAGFLLLWPRFLSFSDIFSRQFLRRQCLRTGDKQWQQS
jgi:hypothetical protein